MYFLIADKRFIGMVSSQEEAEQLIAAMPVKPIYSIYIRNKYFVIRFSWRDGHLVQVPYR